MPQKLRPPARTVRLQSESRLGTVNDTFNSASDLPSLIDNKWKELFLEDHTLKSFARDGLAYLQEAQMPHLPRLSRLQGLSG